MSKSLMDILRSQQNANPSKNYEILHATLEHAKEIHMPCKTILKCLISENTKNPNGSLLE